MMVIDLQILADKIAAPIIKIAYNFFKMRTFINSVIGDLDTVKKSYSNTRKKFYVVHL